MKIYEKAAYTVAIIGMISDYLSLAPWYSSTFQGNIWESLRVQISFNKDCFKKP
jgi:hypothetical protein